MSFQEALDAVVDGLKDISELNVRTWTGTVTTKTAAKNMQELLGESVEGNLELVAMTTMKIDGDVDQFISSSDSVPPTLHTAHSRALDTGQASRKASLGFLRGAIEGGFNKLTE